MWGFGKTTLQMIADIVAVGGLRALNATGLAHLLLRPQVMRHVMVLWRMQIKPL